MWKLFNVIELLVIYHWYISFMCNYRNSFSSVPSLLSICYNFFFTTCLFKIVFNISGSNESWNDFLRIILSSKFYPDNPPQLKAVHQATLGFSHLGMSHHRNQSNLIYSQLINHIPVSHMLLNMSPSTLWLKMLFFPKIPPNYSPNPIVSSWDMLF